ncbi:hypothetical protein [Marinobacter sp. MIT932201]|jgi:hypothetical protein|uniref:hypothetical protein n=1 Tax=Marinobacter sp. MIT932201 TaxID=3096995 RepID=UPI00399A07F2|tara:strand:+ start:437 stop:721 length:285 start_codon:yes stop_codon:yes gene_type:complete
MFAVLRTGPLFDVKSRLVFRSGQWLVRTREIAELGPYPSRLQAIEALYRHVAICSGKLNDAEPEVAREFVGHSVTQCTTSDCGMCADMLSVVPQ